MTRRSSTRDRTLAALLCKLCALSVAMATCDVSLAKEHGTSERQLPACSAHDQTVRVAWHSAGEVGASLGEASGCWRVVTIWAGWCAPCRNELFELADVAGRLRGSGIEFVTINIDAPEDARVAVFLLERARAGTMRNLGLLAAELPALRRNLFPTWRGSIPFTMVIDPAGEVTASHEGAIDIHRLQTYLTTTTQGRFAR